jgi:hypothetical protein
MLAEGSTDAARESARTCGELGPKGLWLHGTVWFHWVTVACMALPYEISAASATTLSLRFSSFLFAFLFLRLGLLGLVSGAGACAPLLGGAGLGTLVPVRVVGTF